MLKPIPKSNITIRPFKTYKEWSFDNTSTEIDVLVSQITGAFADSTSSSDTNLSFYRHPLHGQLRAQFYNGLEDNVFLRIGTKSNSYATNNLQKERLLTDSAKIISIPNKYIGEEIKPGSLTIVDNGTYFTDDSYGNIIGGSDYNGVLVSLLDDLTNEFNFEDLLGNEYSASLSSYDLNTGNISFTLNSTNYNLNVISFDTTTRIMIFASASFLPNGAKQTKVGNVFYDHGLVVFTSAPSGKLLSTWTLDYKSTETIYENEYFLEVNESEFNVSTNPTATITTGSIVEDFVDSFGTIRRVTTYPGVRYVRKKVELENGTLLNFGYQSKVNSSVYGGFGDGYVSQSADPTGSYLTPFITTIGLYDDNNDLVAVAKLPKPIKSELDIPLNFIVRFDT